MSKKLADWDVIDTVLQNYPKATLDDIAMALASGQALTALGFTNEDQESIEDAFYILVQLRQQEETNDRSTEKLMFQYLCWKHPEYRLSDFGEMIETDDLGYDDDVIENLLELLSLYNFLMIDIAVKMKKVYKGDLYNGVTIEGLVGWDDCTWHLPVVIPAGAIKDDASNEEAQEILCEHIFKALPSTMEIHYDDLDFDLVEKLYNTRNTSFAVETMDGEPLHIKKVEEYEYEVTLGGRCRFIRAM